MRPSGVKPGGRFFMKFKEGIDQFIEWKGISNEASTVRGYAQDLKIFCLLLHNKPVEDITLDDVIGCISDMQEAGWTQAALMRKCMALRKFLEFMRMTGHDTLQKELIPIPKPEFTMPRVATEENYKKILSAIPGHRKDPRHIRNRAIIRLLWDSGMRVGELASLNTDDIDLKAMKGFVRTEKNRGSRPFRPIFWTDATNRCLKLWMAKRDYLAPPTEKALFISCVSWRKGQRLTSKGVAEALRRCSNRANLPYMNAHSFRHHMGHEIIKKGGSNSDVANILGHASLLSTLTYTQLSSKEVEDRYRMLKKKL